MSAHQIVHIELPATDGSQASKFYSSVFGWKSQAFLGGEVDYWMFQPETGPGGGFNPVSDQGIVPVKPGDVLFYIDTDNIEASLTKIKVRRRSERRVQARDTGHGLVCHLRRPHGQPRRSV